MREPGSPVPGVCGAGASRARRPGATVLAHLLAATLVSAILGAVVGGCAGGIRPAGMTARSAPLDLDGLGPDAALVFAPATVRVYPLTHLERGADGTGRIVCYLEVKDRWGDALKALGTLQVQLYRPLRDGSLVREAVWDVDLRSPDVNVALFDPVTRAYRVQLGSVPAWVEPMIDRAEARRVSGQDGSGTTDVERMVLRAVFTTIGDDGEPIVLRDDLVVEQ